MKKLTTISSHRLCVLLFLVLWLAYGAAINSANLLDFDLQQIGVEAMVERGHFYLEHSLPGHRQSKGDVFTYRGHNYAAKQPGQFMLGAMVYWLLHKLGLSYVDNYLLSSALVTFFTTSVVVAASGVGIFQIARELTAPCENLTHRVETPRLFWPLATASSYSLGTTVFAYSGIAQHDALASGYLVIAFYLLLRLSKEKARRPAAKALLAGLFLGLTVTTSVLPVFMVATFVLYFLYLRRWRLLPSFLFGLLAGLLPLFIYDAVNFGNPFLLPNFAGAAAFPDTFFYFDPNNLGDKLASYARSVMSYAPVVVLGLVGFSYYPRRVKRDPALLTLLAALLVLVAYVFNIKSDGDCQFGPRYLLPAMPFACLGIVGFSYLATATQRRIAGLSLGLAGAVSFSVNLVGALRGAMNCPHGSNAFWQRLESLQFTNLAYPLAPWLLLPLLLCTVLLLWQLRAERKANC
ncbi:MAG: hypothetical protein QOJ88_239 [Pyrinomonadaceae bacterium]|nr:hypothetical protein [Pyrinomonadaceae bacterium]